MLSRRRLAVAAGMVLILAGGILWLRRQALTRAFPAQQYTLTRGRPYTLLLVTVAPGGDGRRHVTEQRTVAIRRDGAEVWIGVHPEQSYLGPLRRIIRPDGGATLAIERLSLRMTQFIPVRVVDAPAADTPCRAPYETDLGIERLAGVEVRGALYEIPQKTRTMRWDAPGYGCLTLALRHENWVDGRWQWLAEQRALWFSPGDPDPQLFDEAFFRKMKETSPAQLIRRIGEVAGASPADCPACYNTAAIEEWDRQYYRNQSPPR